MSLETISRLIEIHGQGGLSPTETDWQAIFAQPGKVQILNLLAFREHVTTAQGEVSGAAAYDDYVRLTGPVFAKVGGKLLYFGKVAHMSNLDAPGHWDAVILTQYPSADALGRMWLDPDYVTAHTSRASGLQHSQILIFKAPDI